MACAEDGATDPNCAQSGIDGGTNTVVLSGVRLLRQRKFGMSMQGLARYSSTNFLTYSGNMTYIISLQSNTNPLEAGGVVGVQGPVLDFAVDTMSGANPLENVWWLKEDGSIYSSKDGRLLSANNCRSGISVLGRSLEVLCGTVLEHRNLDVGMLPLSTADSFPAGGNLLAYSDGRYFLVTEVQHSAGGTSFSQRIAVIWANDLSIDREIVFQHQATEVVGLTAEGDRFWVLTGGSGPDQDSLYEYQLY
jgi:hypothetical protein